MGWSKDELIEVRRHLHRNPELSTQEHKTAAFIADRLRDLGLEPQVGSHGAPTGVVAVLEGQGGDGPTLAWRADIDALPIVEDTGVEYTSCQPGVMHACGHDVHTTVGLGLAAKLIQNRDQLPGRVKFIFQPAEEGAPAGEIVGAEAMARGGVLDGPDVDAIFALHCMPSQPVGTIGYSRGPVWAGSDAWRLTVKGRQTHGAYPQDGVDPIYVAGQIIVALQGVPGRVVDSRESCVVSVGKIQAGEAFNVIPEEVHMVGLLRTLDEGVRRKALDALDRLFHGICQAHGAEAKVSFSQGAMVVANAPALVDKAVASLTRHVGAEAIDVAPPQMGAEDFASFSRRKPAAYFMLGVGNEGKGIVHPIHSPHFNVDEACLPFAVDAFGHMMVDLARSWHQG